MFPKNNNNTNYVKKIISIQGNIGSGKTTLMTSLKRNSIQLNNIMGINCFFVDEPVEEWKKKVFNENTLSALEIFYEDITTNSHPRTVFPFQIYAFTTRLKLFIEQTSKLDQLSIGFCDRSMISDFEIFLKNLKDVITPFEYSVYEGFYDTICSQIIIKEEIMIYNTCPPEKCFERIHKRGNESEKNITLDYLKGIHSRHLDMIEKFKKNGGKVFEFECDDVDTEKEFNIFTESFLIDFERFYKNK